MTLSSIPDQRLKWFYTSQNTKLTPALVTTVADPFEKKNLKIPLKKQSSFFLDNVQK